MRNLFTHIINKPTLLYSNVSGCPHYYSFAAELAILSLYPSVASPRLGIEEIIKHLLHSVTSPGNIY